MKGNNRALKNSSESTTNITSVDGVNTASVRLIWDLNRLSKNNPFDCVKYSFTPKFVVLESKL